MFPTKLKSCFNEVNPDYVIEKDNESFAFKPFSSEKKIPTDKLIPFTLIKSFSLYYLYTTGEFVNFIEII